TKMTARILNRDSKNASTRAFIWGLLPNRFCRVCKPKELECQGALTPGEKSGAVIRASKKSSHLFPQRFQCRRNGVQLFLRKLNCLRLFQTVTGEVANHQIIRPNHACLAQLLCGGDRRRRGRFGENTGEPAY